MKHELGITGVDLEVVLPEFRYHAEKDGVVENEICPVLIGRFAGKPKLNPTEVNDVRWVNWEEFVVEVADPENGYSPWAREEVELLSMRPAIQEFVSHIGMRSARHRHDRVPVGADSQKPSAG